MLSEQKEIAMRVSGMTCAACASRIEKGLKRMPGVTDANVNLEPKRQMSPSILLKQGRQRFRKKLKSWAITS